MGTGIAREKIGDVLIRGERGADVMTTPEMCEFLTTALTSVRTVKVTASEVDVSELRVPTPKVEEINTSEASTRLDALERRVSRFAFEIREPRGVGRRQGELERGYEGQT